jgi:hypothetical protein
VRCEVLKWVDTRLTFVDPSSGKVLLSVTRSGSRPISEESSTRVIAWFVLGAVAGFIAEHLTGKRGGLVLATVTPQRVAGGVGGAGYALAESVGWRHLR